ncbi:MAG: hypothetical protein MI975_13360 [Cytophagales bacterium]|nr:hypothetical protein [Cytophagales bacterium]
MKRVGIILILLLISSGAFAQNREAMKKIESARIALITERLGLTPDQAEKFWPVYREYNQERREIRREFRDARQGVDMKNLTDEQSKRLVQKSIEMKQKELNLEKEYSNRLSEVISTQQLFKLKNAEKDFQQMLLKRIQDQRLKQGQNQMMKQRREMMMDRNN